MFWKYGIMHTCLARRQGCIKEHFSREVCLSWWINIFIARPQDVVPLGNFLFRLSIIDACVYLHKGGNRKLVGVVVFHLLWLLLEATTCFFTEVSFSIVVSLNHISDDWNLDLFHSYLCFCFLIWSNLAVIWHTFIAYRSYSSHNWSFNTGF
jgi:hypothetical protein